MMLEDILVSIVNPSPYEIEMQGAFIGRHPLLTLATFVLLVILPFLVVGGMS